MKKRNPFTRFAAAALLSMAALAAAPAALAQTTDKPYAYVEQMPVFKGEANALFTFLAENIRFPQEARDAGLEGLVVVSFVVDTDGSVKNATTVKGLSPETDAEALRVVKLMSGKWQPGKQNGKAVAVQYTLPVRFALNDAERAATADVANRMPQFKGGQQAMLEVMRPYLKFPAEADQENLNARVVAKFIVDKDGKVANISVEQPKLKKTIGPGSELDYMDAATFGLQNKTILAKLTEAAANAVKATSGQWQPSLKKGQPVAAELTLPVHFLGIKSETVNASHSNPGVQELRKLKDSYTYDEVDVKPILRTMPLEKFIAKHLRYPANATFEGDMLVHLLITKDGKLTTGPWFSDKNDKLITDEITRVLLLTKNNWTPGKVAGQPVTTARKFIIRFVTHNGTQKTPAQNDPKPDVVITSYK